MAVPAGVRGARPAIVRAIALTFLLAGCVPGSSSSEAPAPPGDVLTAYVERADPSYAWRVRRDGVIAGTPFTELILTSQTWRGIPWRHQLFVFWPRATAAAATDALFLIEAGGWSPRLDDPEHLPELPTGALVVAGVADAIGAPVAVLRQVPFQPLFDGLVEDPLIAHTFERFLQTGDPDWPLLLPMVKSAVRGMDAVQELARDAHGASIQSFTLTGGSKRGWTTWLTAAVDERVRALAPISIDMLSLEAHLDHQLATWGSYSTQIAPYTDAGLHEVLDTPLGRDLVAIVDPFRYRHRLGQPKLIVVGTNDPYWPLDALNLYWDGLPEPKSILYLPNVGHSANDFPRLLAGLVALHRAAGAGTTLPRPEWSFEVADGALRLHVTSEIEPRSVTAWFASAPTRDFREARWESGPCSMAAPGYLCETALPRDGLVALFAEIAYASPNGSVALSTQVAVGP